MSLSLFLTILPNRRVSRKAVCWMTPSKTFSGNTASIPKKKKKHSAELCVLFVFLNNCRLLPSRRAAPSHLPQRGRLEASSLRKLAAAKPLTEGVLRRESKPLSLAGSAAPLLGEPSWFVDNLLASPNRGGGKNGVFDGGVFRILLKIGSWVSLPQPAAYSR